MRFMGLRSSRHLSHLQKLKSLISMPSALNFFDFTLSALFSNQNIFACSF